MKKIAFAVALVCMMAANIAAQSNKFSVWKDGSITTDDGCKIHYIESGTGRKTVLYVHEFQDGAASFKYAAQHLTGDYRLIAYDLRGHGTSDWPKTGYTMDRFAKDLKSLIDQLTLSNVNIVGNSLGMHVVWEYIKQYGDGAFAKIINTAGTPRILNDSAARYNYGIARWTRQQAQEQASSFRTNYKKVMTDAENVLRPYFEYLPMWKEYYARNVNYDGPSMATLQEAWVAADYWDVLPRISKPVLMITAASDWSPKAGFDEQKKQIKVSSSVVVIPGEPAYANHYFPLNLPDKYAAELQKFIQ
jgi:pimeloyl-ACP methyl ester carboxylesterase